MASQAHVANYQASSLAGLLSHQTDSLLPTAIAPPLAARHFAAEDPTPEIIAHAVEFVALPEKTEKLQAAIPEALRNAFCSTGGFSGCIVLISEQEARLVTVITLWTGIDRAKQCDENSKRVSRLLTPFVDRWLRTRRLAAFLATP